MTWHALPAHGLSPRVRGNRAASLAESESRRSIPACAGEPVAFGTSWSRSMVYPRVCGGTQPAGAFRQPDDGLSPRVRGNPESALQGMPKVGSIPACAGEPGGRYYPYGDRRVYPRVCGGTTTILPDSVLAAGLSPRVRGNHVAGPDAI